MNWVREAVQDIYEYVLQTTTIGVDTNCVENIILTRYAEYKRKLESTRDTAAYLSEN